MIWRAVQSLIAVAILFSSGCALMSKPKLAACESEKQQLLARIEQDQNRLVAAEARARLAISQRDEAEKQLARLHDASQGETEIARRAAESTRPPLVSAPSSEPQQTAENPATAGQNRTARDDGWSAGSGNRATETR